MKRGSMVKMISTQLFTEVKTRIEEKEVLMSQMEALGVGKSAEEMKNKVRSHGKIRRS
jgi:hypothetical protein